MPRFGSACACSRRLTTSKYPIRDRVRVRVKDRDRDRVRYRLWVRVMVRVSKG